jgi:outer membrane protein assembly factor BamC
MQYRSVRALLIVIGLTWGLTGGLSGCSWINDGEGLILDPDDDYLDVEMAAPLKVPADLRSLENSDPFPIPPVPESANPRYFPERPPLPDAIYANDNRDEVRLQRLGQRRWLVIPESPTIVWPKLKQFLSENGITLSHDDPAEGRLNTEWLVVDQDEYRDVIRTLLKEAKSEPGAARGTDRFLIRVEQGLRGLTTEVHVRHENDSLTLPVDDEVAGLDVLQSDIPSAEAEFLNEFGAYIAAKVSEQTVSKVAQQIGSSKKAELTRDIEGMPLLRLYLDYERAWATLGQALDNADLEIRSLDESEGLLSVSIPEQILQGDEEDGFFCRLTFSCTDNDVFEVQIRILARADRQFDVGVYAESDEDQLDPDFVQKVLVLIREYAT